MGTMGLARVWRRQLYGASTAALIVPTAMLAALVALALGGAFSGVGVLGQLFVGPSLAGVGSTGGAGSVGVRGGTGVVTAASLPLIPVTPSGARTVAARGAPAGRTVLPAPHHGVSAGGGGIAPVGGTVRPVTQGPGSSAGGQGSAPAHNPAPSPAAPAVPAPQPRTPVDTVVTVVTSVTQQVPALAGPVATQVVQAAGSAADNLLPSSSQPLP